MSEQPRILIIGAGFGGIAAAIELQAHGFADVEILDRGDGLGGTWRFNDYPGAACDVPSHLYSYSFAQRRDWTRLCSPQDEILAYQEEVAREFGVDRRMTFGVEVDGCSWDAASATWTVTAADGRRWEADAVIVATGQLHRPAFPPIPGLEDFAGTAFHSAEWDHACDLRGRRVAVIGTGASAVQFVPPVAEEAGHLTVFQRTGNWFMPRRNRSYPAPVAWAIRRVPGVQAFRRRFMYHYGETLTMMIRHPRTVGLLGRLRSTLFMRWQLRGDDALRRKLWPHYTFGCKRVLFSSMWLPALRRPNVELVTERIERMTPAGPQTQDGVVHEADVVIYGTGFKTADFMFPMEITGERGASLREAWADGPHAHLGITVPGFPSLFLMYGPNTNTSGGSILVYLEAQAAYIRQALALVRERGAAAIEVRPDVEAAADRAVQQRFQGTAWTRCDSWYRDESGRIITNWPGYMREYEAATHALDPADFELLPAADREPAAA
ncbi:MAG: NAD(P)/FAD-dependent oxidoreductase [Solirubrobacteraceae bacterium]|nr:NAD(P)/FAD-dependent oxidoreductase [Solirubrobacteraceae bacterium]